MGLLGGVLFAKHRISAQRYAAPTTYAAPAMSYAAPTTYAAPQMSYVPQATMGGYPGYGAATHSPYLDATTITQQEKDATEALNGQASMQQKMLDHQCAAAQDDVLLDSSPTTPNFNKI